MLNIVCSKEDSKKIVFFFVFQFEPLKISLNDVKFEKFEKLYVLLNVYGIVLEQF